MPGPLMRVHCLIRPTTHAQARGYRLHPFIIDVRMSTKASRMLLYHFINFRFTWLIACAYYIQNVKKETRKFYLLENKKNFNDRKICKKEGNLEPSMTSLRKRISTLR